MFGTKPLPETMTYYITNWVVKNKLKLNLNAFENVICKIWAIMLRLQWVNTLRPRQNGRHFADDPFKCIFLNETLRILIKISLNLVPKSPINNIPALVQIMAWRRWGDKPLSGPMMVRLPTHICVTRPQWVKHTVIYGAVINFYCNENNDTINHYFSQKIWPMTISY